MALTPEVVKEIEMCSFCGAAMDKLYYSCLVCDLLLCEFCESRDAHEHPLLKVPTRLDFNKDRFIDMLLESKVSVF